MLSPKPPSARESRLGDVPASAPIEGTPVEGSPLKGAPLEDAPLEDATAEVERPDTASSPEPTAALRSTDFRESRKDVVRRLAEHLRGRGVGFTRHAKVVSTPLFDPTLPKVSTGWDRVDRLLDDRLLADSAESGSDAHDVAAGGDPASAAAGEKAPPPDRGGLARGVLHEWLGLENPVVVPSGVDAGVLGLAPRRPPRRPPGSGPAFDRVPDPGHRHDDAWSPPLLLLAHLARRALDQPVGALEADVDPQGWAVWIGRRVWPYPHTLLRRESRASPRAPDGSLPEGARTPDGDAPSEGPLVDHALLARSVFVDPPDAGARVWAIDAALRCPSVSVVVADGSGLRLAASRRLQLAAEAGRALALLARPPWERVVLSAASTRWLVQRAAPSSGERARPAWTLRLLRARGGGGVGAATAFADPDVDDRLGRRDDLWACALEWTHAMGLVELAVFRDRPGATALGA